MDEEPLTLFPFPPSTEGEGDRRRLPQVGLLPVLIFNREGHDVNLTLLALRDLRLPLKTTPAGKPLERAKTDAVELLLAEDADC